MDGEKITRGFLEGFMKHDEDVIEIVNAYVNIDKAIGIIEDMNKPNDEYSKVKQLIDELDDGNENDDIIEISCEDADAPGKTMDVFIYRKKSDNKPYVFIAHNDYAVVFWN